MLIELIIFLLLLHLAYDDYTAKEVYNIECLILFIVSVYFTYPNILGAIFALIAATLPLDTDIYPLCDRIGLASMAFIDINAMILSVVILLVLSRLKITTAYYPAAFIAYVTVEILKIIYI